MVPFAHDAHVFFGNGRIRRAIAEAGFWGSSDEPTKAVKRAIRETPSVERRVLKVEAILDTLATGLDLGPVLVFDLLP